MDLSALLPVFLAVLVLLSLGVLAMAVGVMFKRPCLRGSCGGSPPLGPDGQALSCATCPNSKRKRKVAGADPQARAAE